jgi:hypothetical protein
VTVRWIDDFPSQVRWLGAPPPSCFGKPGFNDCYASHFALAKQFCDSQGLGPDCVQYQADLLAYENCRQYCAELAAPVKPATFPTSSGGGKPNVGPVRQTSTTSTESTTSGSGGLLIAAAAAIVAVVIIANLT